MLKPLVIVPCVLIVGCASSTTSDSGEARLRGEVSHQAQEDGVFAREPDEARIAEAIRKWSLFFGRAGAQAQSEDGVELLLKAKYRDKARFYWPGTGEYELVYLIDDFVQIHMKCDWSGRVYDRPVAEKRTGWLRETDGSLLVPP